MSEQSITEALAAYHPTEAKIAEAREEYMLLTVDGIDDKEGFKLVHAARMDVRSGRIHVEKTRKLLKADALEYGRAVDAEAKRINALIAPIEAHLAEQERVVEEERERLKAEQAERVAAKLAQRMEALDSVGDRTPSFHVESLSDDEFASLFAGASEMHAERERIAKVEREAAEAVMAAREAEEAKAAEERREEEAKLVKERAELEVARAEAQEAEDAARAKLDAERAELEAEKARIAKLDADRVREAEIEQAREDAALKAKADDEAKEKREAAEAALVKDLAPDAEKVRLYLKAVSAISIPQCAWSGLISNHLFAFIDGVEETIQRPSV